MQLIRISSKAVAVLAAAVLAVALASCAAPEASEFVGKYKTEDTQGKPMTITLSEDGSATGERVDESLKGTWKEEDGAAVITWSDGWTTKIAKEGDKYVKTAYKAGSTEPVHTADAEKIE